MCLGKNSKEKTGKHASDDSYNSVNLTDMNKMIKSYDKISSKNSTSPGKPDFNRFSVFKHRFLNSSLSHDIGGDGKHKHLKMRENSDSGMYPIDSYKPIPGRFKSSSAGSYDPNKNMTDNDTNDLEVEVFKGDSSKASPDNAVEDKASNKIFQFANKYSENDAIFNRLNIKSPNIETDVSESNQKSTSKISQENNDEEENNGKERSTNVNKGNSADSSMLQFVKNTGKHKSKSKDKDKSSKRPTNGKGTNKKRGKSSKKTKKRKKIKKSKKLGSENSMSESGSSESNETQKDKDERSSRKKETKASSSIKPDFHPISIPKVNSITSVSSDPASTTSSSSMESSSNSSIKSSSSESSVKRKKVKPKEMKSKKAKSRKERLKGKGPLNSIYFVIINSIPKCSDTIKQNFEIPYMLKSKTRDSIIPIIQVPNCSMTKKIECDCQENIKYLANNCESTSSSCCSRIVPKFKVTGFYPDYNNTTCTCSQFDCDNESNLI